MPSVLGGSRIYMPEDSREPQDSAIVKAEQAFADANDLANRVINLVERLAGGVDEGPVSDEMDANESAYLRRLRQSAGETSARVREAHARLDHLEAQL